MNRCSGCGGWSSVVLGHWPKNRLSMTRVPAKDVRQIGKRTTTRCGDSASSDWYVVRVPKVPSSLLRWHCDLHNRSCSLCSGNHRSNGPTDGFQVDRFSHQPPHFAIVWSFTHLKRRCCCGCFQSNSQGLNGKRERKESSNHREGDEVQQLWRRVDLREQTYSYNKKTKVYRHLIKESKRNCKS